MNFRNQAGVFHFPTIGNTCSLAATGQGDYTTVMGSNNRTLHYCQ